MAGLNWYPGVTEKEERPGFGGFPGRRLRVLEKVKHQTQARIGRRIRESLFNIISGEKRSRRGIYASLPKREGAKRCKLLLLTLGRRVKPRGKNPGVPQPRRREKAREKRENYLQTFHTDKKFFLRDPDKKSCRGARGLGQRRK